MEPDRPYTVLARRFRPQTFSEVVGQQQIGQALQNAIRSGRVAHAYLFTGARGVGKTSTARILAKALNCPNVVSSVPCNDCEVCRSVSAGTDVDVLEIDGASNRGIDDIRTLRSNVNVRSMRSPNKVYIIDEVHMLTKEAFNALLKTLEEPPSNVKFVFCTTEPNKVPDTILSRCQRFDFGTIATDSIAGRLQEIAEREGIRVDPEAVDLVARRAGGSMRDSQSMFDQLLAFGSEHITAEDVHRLLGTAPDDRLFNLFEAVIAGDRRSVLEQLDTALQEGAQLGSLADQFLGFLRDLMLLAAGAESVSLLALGPGARPRVLELGQRWGLRRVGAALQILTEARSRMQRATYGRVLMELALVRMTLLEDLDSIGSLVEQLASGATAERPSLAAAPRMARPTPSASSLESGSKKNDSQPAERRFPPAPVGKLTEVAETGLSESVGREELRSNDAPRYTLHDFEAGWPTVIAEMPETLGNHLKNCVKAAISGPNALEILFGPSYFLSKSYCERPEAVRRIETVVNQVFGAQVQVVIRLDGTNAATTTKRDTQKTYNRKPVSVVQDDPYVQHTLTVFGGSIVDLRELARTDLAGDSAGT